MQTLRDYLVKRGDRVKALRRSPDQTVLRGQLDETLLAFRAARKTAGSDGAGGYGWLRAVRKATGVPSDVLAKRLGVERPEVFRLERMERESRIMLANLERAAAALGCELMYALVPREGSLEDLAEMEREARAQADEMARGEQKKNAGAIERWLGVPAAARRHLRREMRKMGIRVR